MGRRAAVVGAVGRARARAAVHDLRRRRRADGARRRRAAAARCGSAARPQARYDLGCLYAGVNDVRSPDWDRDAFAADYALAYDALAARCDRVLVVTIPLDLGRPRAGRAVEEANAVIEARDALVLDLRAFGARNLVMADHVHPTAFGQVWIAERALEVLAADGMDVRVRPSTLIAPGGRTRAARAAGRLDLRLPLAQGVGSCCSGCSCRGSGAPSCLSRLGT